MKKKLGIVFAACAMLIFALALTGCGKKYTSIPLGGELPDIELEGSCYGSGYKVVDTPEEQVYEDTEATFYYCADCDTPYIAVYRWDAVGLSFEESLKISADLEGAEGELYDIEGFSAAGRFCSGVFIDDEYYYADTLHFRYYDEAIEISFYAATEEISLGTKGLYAYIPLGYEDKTAEHDAAICDLWAEYEDCYDIPDILIDSFVSPRTFEDVRASWSETFSEDEFPITEEDWARFQNDGFGWTQDSIAEYFKKCGYELLYSSEMMTVEGASVDFVKIRATGEDTDELINVIYINKDGETVEVWLFDDAEQFCPYARTFINSIHTK